MTGDRIGQLEAEIHHLMHEVERYRTATDDTLQQVNWCIGYLTGTRKGHLAKSLSANRDHIRSNLLGRAAQSVPTTDAEEGAGGEPLPEQGRQA